MADALADYAALLEATRPRLSTKAIAALRDHQEAYEALQEDAHDKLIAAGLSLLLDMHDRLEAIRHGRQ